MWAAQAWRWSRHPARPAAPVQLPPILSAVAVLHCNSELMQAVFVPSCQIPCKACEPPILACGSRRHDAAHRYRSVPPVARHKKPGTLAGSVVVLNIFQQVRSLVAVHASFNCRALNVASLPTSTMPAMVSNWTDSAHSSLNTLSAS